MDVAGTTDATRAVARVRFVGLLVRLRPQGDQTTKKIRIESESKDAHDAILWQVELRAGPRKANQSRTSKIGEIIIARKNPTTEVGELAVKTPSEAAPSAP